jgi:hypothetical protein
MATFALTEMYLEGRKSAGILLYAGLNYYIHASIVPIYVT